MSGRKDYQTTPHAVIMTCEVCSTEFRVPLSKFKAPGYKARFCGQACYGAWRKGKRFGDYTPPPADKVVEMYLACRRITEVAAHFKTSTATVTRYLDEAGVAHAQDGRTLQDPAVRAKALATIKSGKEHANFVELPTDELVRLYNDGESTEKIAGKYGVNALTINRRLRDAGVTMRRPGFSRYRRCKDGHVVQSTWEYAVDNWLSDHNIAHESQPIAPWYTGGSSPHRADFRVGDIFIEVWGVVGNAKYEARRQEKIAKYQECGVRLIQVFPHHILDSDFSPLEVLLQSP